MQRIIHVLNIKVFAEKVFDAIATEKGLSNWWSTRVKAEENVGGTVDFTFITGFNPVMKILVLDKPTNVGWECVAGHELWQDNRFSFEMLEVDTGTQLKFTQEYAKEIGDKDYGTYNFNWGYYLQSLKEYCETGKGKPFTP